ncbi:TPA: transcription termination/antitermination NusG family protein [Salmonella enterica subsp. enterica serovar Paratyphi B]
MRNWYLLYYKSRHYKNITQYLSGLNIPFYMPMRAVLSPRADSLTSHRRYEVPFFPGYVFIHLDVDETHPSAILKVPSVIDFVRTGNEIKKIPDAVIIGLQIAPVVIEEINFINSPPAIYCENCPYDVLQDVIKQFNKLSESKNDDERVIWLLHMIDEIINKPRQEIPDYRYLRNKTQEQKTSEWLGKIMKLKTESFT